MGGVCYTGGFKPIKKELVKLLFILKIFQKLLNTVAEVAVLFAV